MFKWLCKIGIHRYNDKIMPYDHDWWLENVPRSKYYLDCSDDSKGLSIIVYQKCKRCNIIGRCVKCNIDM